MKQGFRVIDTDTHVGPNMETLSDFAAPRLQARWDELHTYYQPITLGGHNLSVEPLSYRRRMGEGPQGPGGAATSGNPLKGSVSKAMRVPAADDVNNLNSKGRLEDMDREGADAHLIIPATFGLAVTALDLELTREVHAAYQRYIATYCATDPARLKATMLVPGGDPEWAAAEIEHWADEPWLAAVTVVLPEGLPVDDPTLHPIWRAMNGHDLPILHHSFFYEPPYFPGARDVWGNVVVARAAAHPWGAQRLLAYLTLSGLFDQYPRLRVGFSECSAGWLPSWLVRLKGQASYMANAVPETALDPMDYARAGRISCGVELYEGGDIARSVTDLVGDGVLMFASDYPHNQCEFPDSPDEVLGWPQLTREQMTKIMATNAESYLRI